MRSVEQFTHDLLSRVDTSTKQASLYVIAILVLAYGFEMTNLTLHHDDVAHIFIQDDILGHYLGRFGFGKLHLYLQNAYILPFVQVAEGILFLTAYGLLVSKFWGLSKTLDIVLVAAILGAFPFMGQLYQYNTSVAPFSFAHQLAAGAVMLSTKGSARHVILAAVLYTAAFSIYQSVIANAAAIFGIWALAKVTFADKGSPFFSRTMLKAIVGAILAVCAGGGLYLFSVSLMDLEFDSYQAAGEAFNLQGILSISSSVAQVLHGTRAFFLWPENYFPFYLKSTQWVIVAASGAACIWLPKGIAAKVTAIGIFGLTLLTPRVLQALHPNGVFHNLTLTAYAVLIAGFVMILSRSGNMLLRNSTSILALFLIGGYVLQCNWISTVNYLNTTAHVSTLTQILARLRSLPDRDWDGKTIAVVGRYDMRSDYPYKAATGVATEYMDAIHMQHLARLMRDDARFLSHQEAPEEILKYAATKRAWPHSSSVGVVDGMGVVILSKDDGNVHSVRLLIDSHAATDH